MTEKHTLVLPKLAEDMTEVVLCAWAVEPGQSFEPGQVLYEVEADKVVHQVEATEKGTLLDQVLEEGDRVQAGDLLAHWSK